MRAPDPDMPVRGLEKYISAISNLFDVRASSVELLDLQVTSVETLGMRKGENAHTTCHSTTLQVLAPDLILSRWRLDATLKLPWRPSIKAYTGVTLYELDRQGLVARHTELWSISALDAFVSAVLPNRPGAGALSLPLPLPHTPLPPPCCPHPS